MPNTFLLSHTIIHQGDITLCCDVFNCVILIIRKIHCSYSMLIK